MGLARWMFSKCSHGIRTPKMMEIAEDRWSAETGGIEPDVLCADAQTQVFTGQPLGRIERCMG
jgi:hypothetical protein